MQAEETQCEILRKITSTVRDRQGSRTGITGRRDDCSKKALRDRSRCCRRRATVAGVTAIGAAETTKPERVARRFLAAYGAYDAKGALKYLAKEGIATGSGITGLSWGTREEFRREVSMAKAQRQKQTVTGCEEQGESSDGVAVQCAFDHHEFRSDEVGLGPYTDNYWDLVVRRREDHLGRVDPGLHHERLLRRAVGALPALGDKRASRGSPDHVPGGRVRDHQGSHPAVGAAHPGVGGGGEGRRRVTRKGRRGSVAAFLVLLAGTWSRVGLEPRGERRPPARRVPRPPVEVSGPVQGGAGQATPATQDLPSLGYAESEYFFGGTATAYAGARKPNGVWNARPAASADFRSRMIVRRPQDPARFSGTVVVEWLNTTTGRDLDASWGAGADEIIREGHAWVGVSAQQPGVRAMVAADPQRYGSLDHPGTPFSLDIFTQAGRALTRHSGAAPLADLEPEHLIALGQSGSASYLISYVNGVQPLVEVFDGFLLHTPAQAGRIRADLEQPTLVFVTESELAGFGYASVRQPDSDSVRTWEVAGAAHADGVLLKQSGYASACPSVNEGPHRQTLRAALHHLVAWTATGEAPPKSPRVKLVTETGKGRRVVIERDEHGNAVGGIRTPLWTCPCPPSAANPRPAVRRSADSSAARHRSTPPPWPGSTRTTTPTSRPSPRRPRPRSTPDSSSDPKPTR